MLYPLLTPGGLVYMDDYGSCELCSIPTASLPRGSPQANAAVVQPCARKKAVQEALNPSHALASSRGRCRLRSSGG